MRSITVLIICLCLLFSLLLGIALTADEVSAQDIAAPFTALRRLRVPILMYHYVGDLPLNADRIRRGLTVSPREFEAQMQYLADNAYQVVRLDDLYAALAEGAPLPANPVVLTFDDGYLDAYTQVYPILRAFGVAGTFFIITARADANDPAYMTWAQIAEMSSDGMEIQPHTKNHIDLRNRSYDTLVYEILGSLESIIAYTARPVTAFSYPAGQYDSAAINVLRQTPVRLAVTTQPGAWHTSTNLLELARVRISGGTSLAAFAALLRRD